MADLLAAARGFQPELRTRARQIESARQLPADIAQKLHNDLRTALARPELQKKYEALGTYTRVMSLPQNARCGPNAAITRRSGSYRFRNG